MTLRPTAPSEDRAARKVNILLVASALWIGGAEMVIKHLATTLDPRRFRVTVCHFKGRGQVGEELVRAGVDVVDLSESGRRVDYVTFRKLLRLIRDRHIDVVHTHTTMGLVDAGICKLLSRRVKIVHTFHFGNYPHTRPRIIWMERLFSRLANQLCAVGEVQRQQLRSVFGFSSQQICTVWNGTARPLPTSDTLSSAELVGQAGDVVVGTIATMVEQKGLPDLIRVAARVRDAGHRARFVIVGEGVLRTQLEAMRRELGLENVVMLPGWIPNASERALPAFDIFFQPSLWEAMSVVILEAMAAGKPIVATRVGENRHVIDDGVTGLLTEPRDIDSMAMAVGRLIGDAMLRRQLGDAAQRRWEEAFTLEHMARAYERVYLDLV